MSTYSVDEKVESKVNVLSYSDFMQIADQGFGLVGFAQLQCWAVEIDSNQTPYTAMISSGAVTRAAPINGPPPPTIKPSGSTASLIFVNSFISSHSSYATFPSGPANVYIMPWHTPATPPMSISTVASALLTVTGNPPGTTRYHLYNIADPGGTHPFNNTTIAIPVPTT